MAERIDLAPGVEMTAVFGADLPVDVVWLAEHEPLETIAVGDGVVYVADVVSVSALEAATGLGLWRFPDLDDLQQEELHSSGGVEIGPAAAGSVRVVAPREYDIELDPLTGRLLRDRLTDSGDDELIGAFRPFPASPPRDFEIRTTLDAVAARSHDSTTGFLISVDRPMNDEIDPVQVGEILIIGLTSMHVVGLRARV